jgi:hypothetical protein
MGSKYSILYRQYDEKGWNEYQTEWIALWLFKLIKVSISFECIDGKIRK